MKRRRNGRVLFIFGWIVFALVMLLGGQGPSDVQAKSKTLTTQTVKQFLDSYPDVRKIAVGEAASTGADIATAKDKFTAVIQVASDKSLQKKVDAAVKPHGFRDAKEWMSVAESVGKAYMHLKTGGGEAKKQKKMEKALAKIEKLDFLSDEQKEKLAQGIRKKAGAMLEPPPPENIAAVQPMVGDIEAVVK